MRIVVVLAGLLALACGLSIGPGLASWFIDDAVDEGSLVRLALAAAGIAIPYGSFFRVRRGGRWSEKSLQPRAPLPHMAPIPSLSQHGSLAIWLAATNAGDRLPSFNERPLRLGFPPQ